jgi:uncharacterized protein (DUF1810 family)
MSDEFDLERFVRAQDSGGTYAQALAELRNGRKVSHWMWFVFPQIAGLGRSATAREFALSSVREAQAYLDHEVLGPRLRESAAAVAAVRGRTAVQVFGSVDALKLRSSMTLFSAAAPDEPVFAEVLEGFFGGEPDKATLGLID